jgi:choline dehydrogenase-like flavoprotein
VTEVIRSPRIYDVCVIGSGASGGIAVHVLTQAGLDIVLLEAGPKVNPEMDFKQHVWPYELPARGTRMGLSVDDLMAPNGFWKIRREPYTCARGSRFYWFRSRILGGRTNHWGQGAHRFSYEDFRGYSRDGAGDDWPLSYDDVEPYYRKVEDYIGVYGVPAKENEGRMSSPSPRCTELFIRDACDKIGIACAVAPGSILTRSHNGRPACHYCGQCWRGCRAGSCFSSLLPIREALETGHLQLITEAMVREIIVGTDGRVKAVSYIDKIQRKERQIRTKAVLVAAGACESARLLLNSKSTYFPNGLANSSGMVGHNLRDTMCSRGEAYFPQLENIPPHNHDGTGRPHLWIPWGKRLQQEGFLRGYHILFIGGRYMPLVGQFDAMLDRFPGYGRALKERCRRTYGCIINFIAGGEMLPNKETYCEVDPNMVDEWGIPVLRFHFKWGENELKMAQDMQCTIRGIVDAGCGEYLTEITSAGEFPYGMSAGGQSFHEQGTVRMGADPRTSVLNAFCQAHDVRNLFVIDGSCFVSSSEKPPTLTIMALAWRAAEYLVNEAKRRSL